MESTNTRQHFNLNRTLFLLLHLINKRSHSVNSCISRTDYTDRFTLLCISESFFSPFPFFLHTCIDTEAIGLNNIFYKLKIVFITYNHIRYTNGIQYSRGYIFFRPRAYPCNYYFSCRHIKMIYHLFL